jgi:type I restriction enzyme S subunit
MYCVSDIQVAYTTIDCTTNQACCALISESELKSSYLFYALKYSGSSLMSSANGSAQINLSKEIIQDFHILFPHSKLIKNDFFRLNLKAKEKCTRENILLEKLKDLLLSKLATIEN